jgi:hypothetical protein
MEARALLYLVGNLDNLKKPKIFLVDREPLTGKLMPLSNGDFQEMKNNSTFEPYQSQGYVITV